MNCGVAIYSKWCMGWFPKLGLLSALNGITELLEIVEKKLTSVHIFMQRL
jgi:hypothetical protein